MSSSLVWQPVNKKKHYVSGIGIKQIIEKKYGYPHILSEDDVAYFMALDDAGVEGAIEIVEALARYDEIEINLEY